MAEALVGSALLSVFFNVLFDKLATEEVKNFLRPKKVIKKLLDKLEDLLWSADELLDDAEEKLIFNQRVENWHNKLKDVVYKASELADKIETEALRRNLEGHQSACNICKMFRKLCSNWLNSFDNYVKHELEEILSSLNLLMDQKDALGLVPTGTGRSNYSGVTPAERSRVTPVADESGFCGREYIKETIIQSLRSGEVGGDKVSVIPVIGPGGIGKTTLDQIIYDHPQVKQLFGEVRAWITVSTDVRELPDSIGTLCNLQTLLLSGCRSLTRLPSNHGSLMNLHHLDIRNSPKLEFLGNWRYGSRKDLKIEKCEALKSIPLDYFPKVERFVLSRCKNFESFRFAEEPPLVLESLTYLELIELPKLRSLPQKMHRLLPSLDTLRIIKCGEINSWPEGGLPSNLKSLLIWGCKKLAAQVMHRDLQVTSLKELRIDGCGEELLDSFPPEGLLPTSLTSLEIRRFQRLKTLNIHAFQQLKQLIIYFCDELQCLPEESLPNSLSFLSIVNCPLLEGRYQKETGKGWQKISHIRTVKINWIVQH